MLRAVDVNLDATEMVLTLEKENSPRKIEYMKIDRLEKVKEPVRKLLRTVEVDGIKVTVRGMEEPIVITSDKLGDYDHVENYLLRTVAEKYDVAVLQ
ncbi:hypothetical protein [Cohnella thailandensis]|uniref:Uncharacterized protein n=1 Tax=Cohnella thailandensis TaxID=557557 RepID=A0A841T2V9_9BACL|nr:hypothetical protein [Cohnella thailandensis]MBB6637196.1 hypothetical protein [Cohnella thailandensis]MBP1976982.1 hypothetical protein [Cohnella thailandensis]